MKVPILDFEYYMNTMIEFQWGNHVIGVYTCRSISHFGLHCNYALFWSLCDLIVLLMKQFDIMNVLA